MKRGSGILFPIFSLPSKHGIGSLGHEAYRFVDFLSRCGQSYWQILPVGHTHASVGNSPYSALSSFAGDPIYIDLDILHGDGLLSPHEYEYITFGYDPSHVDYGRVRFEKGNLLRLAYDRFLDRADKSEFDDFVKNNEEWLEDYCLFMTISDEFGFNWLDWPEKLKKRDKKELDKFKSLKDKQIGFHKFLQYEFFKQYRNLKAYANSKGVAIIGDLPIYTPLESADCWSWSEYFQLNENYVPISISGVPPDRYSVDGQIWEHPLYDWEELKKHNYDYWVMRVKINSLLYDYLRLDHFIGFVNYFAIPNDNRVTRLGHWEKGPGLDLFKVLKQELGDLNLIAEDLGSTTDEVLALKDRLGFPGMRVLQFGFSGEDNINLPHNYDNNCVAYSSTQDSDTFMGWLNSVSYDERNRTLEYLCMTDYEGYHWGCVRYLLSSVNGLSIFQLQDILGLGSEGRINIPGVRYGCWEWRCTQEYDRYEIVERLNNYMRVYKRYRHN